MAEVLTEKLAETAESVDTTAVGSATTETNENGEKAYLADGTLLEEMKKAVKQSAFNLFLVIESLVYLAHFLFLGVPVQKKKVEFYFADANLPYDKCNQFFFWVISFSLYSKWAVFVTGLCGPCT